MYFFTLIAPHTCARSYKFTRIQKGKLEELNFIMSGGGIGGLHTYAPDFYQDEPWVEFIEVDAEDAEAAEKEDNQGSDTQRLLGLSQPTSHQHTHTGCSNAFRYHSLSFHDVLVLLLPASSSNIDFLLLFILFDLHPPPSAFPMMTQGGPAVMTQIFLNKRP